MDLDPLIVPFGLVLARVGAFVSTCPMFVPDNVALQIRAAVTLLLSVSLTAALPHYVVPVDWPQALLVELLLGLLLSGCVRLVAVAVGFAGEMVDVHLGFGFARIMNPAMSEETTPVMHLAQLLCGLTFLMAGGQHHVIASLAHSLTLFEPGAGSLQIDWFSLLVNKLGPMLQLGILMALPLVMAMMCVQLGLALLSRLAPQLNIWALGLLGTCGLGLLALWAFLPAWTHTMMELWSREDTWALGGIG